MDSWIDSGFNYFILNSSLRFSVTHSTDIYSSQIKKNHLQWQPNLAQQQGKPLMQGTLTPEGISCWYSAYPQLAAIQNILWPRCWLLPTRQKAVTNLNNNQVNLVLFPPTTFYKLPTIYWTEEIFIKIAWIIEPPGASLSSTIIRSGMPVSSLNNNAAIDFPELEE